MDVLDFPATRRWLSIAFPPSSGPVFDAAQAEMRRRTRELADLDTSDEPTWIKDINASRVAYAEVEPLYAAMRARIMADPEPITRRPWWKRKASR